MHIYLHIYIFFIYVAFIYNWVGSGFQGVLWRPSGWVWLDCIWPILVGLSRQIWESEACRTGAIITNCGAVSTSLILMAAEEGMNHIKEKIQPPALKNQSVLPPSAFSGSSPCPDNVSSSEQSQSSAILLKLLANGLMMVVIFSKLKKPSRAFKFKQNI